MVKKKVLVRTYVKPNLVFFFIFGGYVGAGSQKIKVAQNVLKHVLIFRIFEI